MVRINDGEWRGTTDEQRAAIIREYEAESEFLDCYRPTLDAWLLAKLYDVRLLINGAKRECRTRAGKWCK